MQKITPFLWFDDRAEEAAKFYVSIFPNSRIRSITRYGQGAAEASGRPQGSVMTVAFEIDGQEFTALNGGPHFTFNEAVSFVVHCKTQTDIDNFWEKLSEGGKTGQCGWLKDKYGVSWQVVPTRLLEMLQDKDAEKLNNVMKAILQMDKINLQALQEAYERQ